MKDIDEIWENSIATSSSFQTQLAEHYESSKEDAIFQEAAKNLPPELVFDSTEQRSAYLLFQVYKRTLLDGKDPDDEFVLPETDGFEYHQLALYSVILFGDIHEAIRGIQYTQVARDYDIRCQYKFITVLSELDPVTDRIVAKKIKGELNEKVLVQKYPNPFKPNLSRSNFFNRDFFIKSRQQETAEDEKESDSTKSEGVAGVKRKNEVNDSSSNEIEMNDEANNRPLKKAKQ